MKLSMAAYATDRVLAGSIEGQKAFADLIQRTPVTTALEVCYLDFNAVEVATASFLRESVLIYRNHMRATRPFIFPVVANLSANVEDELGVYLKATNDALVACDLGVSGEPENIRLLGSLEGKQHDALIAVIEAGETDAPELAKRFGNDVVTTAWNNRLGALAAKGILIPTASGRKTRYRTVLGGLRYGT